MRILDISKIEFYKILKKRLSLVMLATLFIPIFYTFSTVTDADLLQMMPSGALDYCFAQWDLLGMTGLFQVLFSLITVSAFASEIEKGQLKLTVFRLGGRKKIVYAKVLALVAFMLMCYLIFMLFSLLCYYLFVTHTAYGTGEFVSAAVRQIGISRFLIGGLFPMMDTLITAGIVFLFSLRYKTGICFMLAIGTSVTLLVMQFFPGICYLVPAYVGMLLSYGQISGAIAGGLCAIYLAIVGFCVWKTANKFERMDLK